MMTDGGRNGGRPTRANGLYVTVQVRVTDHFLRRPKERGADSAQLDVEGGLLDVAGWLRAIHDRDYSLIVPGFGQIRIRIDRFYGGFVAVTFLPLGAS